ncbi:hypothetical protein [Paraburkholderia tropica]|uniref:hypothetical protein n=1 Tax=Paraburkholderia tropica TaxID=92647 RepID=UPI002AB7ED92|nr:hypothetical protein [Paraburkholderia tropica]
MFTKSDLTHEISRVIVELDTRHQRKHPDWITETIMSSHAPPVCDDADVYLFNTRANVRDAVGAHLRRAKLKTDVTPDAQLVLEGFERLQKEYLIDDDGAQVSVPIEELSDGQLMEKYHELRAMGDGCYLHADEILRYIDARNAGRAAAGGA